MVPPFESEAPWRAARRRLQGRRLLTPADRVEVARLHRLISTHIRATAGAEVEAAMAEFLLARVADIDAGRPSPAWQFEALLEALIPRAAASRTFARQLNKPRFFQRVGAYVGDDRPLALARIVHSACEELAAAQPGNLDAQRDVSVSLNNVAGILKTSEPGGALGLYRRSLTIAEELAAAQPGNLDAQRDVYVSLYLIAIAADEGETRTEAQAQGYFSQACELMRQAEAAGWLPEADRQFMDYACQRTTG